jgi:hypothetical protein
MMRDVRSLGPRPGDAEGFGDSATGALTTGASVASSGDDDVVDVGVGDDETDGVAFAPVATSRADKTATPATIATGLTAFAKTVRKSM